ncbi:MAG: alpha/beta hydrolase [Actinobacteria bacterium]|nr:alpha/beta hydrolase [Actinomycetota bacterium]
MAIDMQRLLDPELQEILGAFEMPSLDRDVLATFRANPFPTVERSGAVKYTEHEVPGDPAVPVRVYRASESDVPRPALLHIHGGGYIIGSYTMDEQLFDRWCPKLDIVGVSVDYRLAPEHPYPAALDDCYAALAWTFERADELGIDRDRIGIGGISAGGGLSAALALLARDRGELPVAFQLLDCPMLDDRQHTQSIGLEGLYVWTRESNEFGWRSYLGDLYGTSDLPIYAAAARATDLAALPPAFVSVGAIDGFRDEDVDYATRLNQAGVPCELHVYPGLPHGYGLVPGAAMVKRALSDVDDWLARQVSR